MLPQCVRARIGNTRSHRTELGRTQLPGWRPAGWELWQGHRCGGPRLDLVRLEPLRRPRAAAFEADTIQTSAYGLEGCQLDVLTVQPRARALVVDRKLAAVAHLLNDPAAELGARERGASCN